MTDLSHRRVEPAVAWHWSFFLLGAVYALPALVVIPLDLTAGIGLAIGVLPVAVFNLPGVRTGRRVIILVGFLSGISFFLGSLLTQVPALAVVAIFAIALGSALWARASRIGVLALALCVPLVGIALSIQDLMLGLTLAALVIVGALYAWAVSMLWPERQVPVPPRPPSPPVADTVLYGVLLGLAGAAAAAIGYAVQAEHVGWATGAALLVMRPARDQLILRSVGRAASVMVGAFAAAALASFGPGPVVIAVAVGLALAALTATQGSRWYVAPGFTSFIVLLVILQGPGEQPAHRFAERVLETCLGVGLALLFGALIPAIIKAWRQRKEIPHD